MVDARRAAPPSPSSTSNVTVVVGGGTRGAQERMSASTADSCGSALTAPPPTVALPTSPTPTWQLTGMMTRTPTLAHQANFHQQAPQARMTGRQQLTTS